MTVLFASICRVVWRLQPGQDPAYYGWRDCIGVLGVFDCDVSEEKQSSASSVKIKFVALQMHNIFSKRQRAMKITVNPRAVLAEFVTTLLLVFVGCSTALLYSQPGNCNNNGTIALVFGTLITTLVYATSHISGQINPAVTAALVIVKEISWLQGLANVLAQFVASIVGTALLYLVIPRAGRTSFGSNSISPGFSLLHAFMGEVIMTALLVYIVLECAIRNNQSIAGALAPIAIGIAVFVGHVVLIPVTGCSLNPARSFGPALLDNNWGHYWVFVVAPIVGSLIATGIHRVFRNIVTATRAVDRFNNGFVSGERVMSSSDQTW